MGLRVRVIAIVSETESVNNESETKRQQNGSQILVVTFDIIFVVTCYYAYQLMN